MSIKITAGGGIVENEEGKILFQFRRGKWDLPKGKLEDGETIEECAIREVEEETGLKNVEIGELLGVTSHNYVQNGENIEKETYWFSMKVAGHQVLVPQVEEDILELRWVAENELQDYLSNTYKNVSDMIEKYFDGHNQVN